MNTDEFKKSLQDDIKWFKDPCYGYDEPPISQSEMYFKLQTYAEEVYDRFKSLDSELTTWKTLAKEHDCETPHELEKYIDRLMDDSFDNEDY